MMIIRTLLIAAASAVALLLALPPPVTAADGSPLDAALAGIGRTRDSYSLPLETEGYYRTVGRHPVITNVAGNPFYLPRFAEQWTDALSAAQSPADEWRALLDVAQQGAPPAVNAAPPPVPLPASLSPSAQTVLRPLVAAVAACQQQTRQALQPLGERRIEFLAGPDSYFFEKEQFRFMTGPVERQMQLLTLARTIDYPALFAAQEQLLRAAAAAIAAVRDAGAKFPPEPVQFDLSEATGGAASGLVIIGSPMNDAHSVDAVLILDPGGDDTYTNNAGGAVSLEIPCALLVDLSGNDTYQTVRAGSQGGAVAGIGALVDAQGDDSYSGASYAQGGAVAGAAALVDLKGNDTYKAGSMSQGAALFGIAALLDLAGDDEYRADTQAQGFASTMGFAVLHDRSGDDRYSARGQFVQGSGSGCRAYPWLKDFTIYGGCGLLLDDDGHDGYLGGDFSQGASYLLSLGILRDRNGNDRYDARGSYSHGGGVHLTNAILIDDAGHDHYLGTWCESGCGNDRSIGIFYDKQGNDVHTARLENSQAYSHKPFGLSLLIDVSGDDIYEAPGHSQGYALPPVLPQEWSTSLFLDLGGRDSYSVAGRQDNAIARGLGDTQPYTWFQDTEADWPAAAFANERPRDPYLKNVSPLEGLRTLDPFVRFSAIGSLADQLPLAKLAEGLGDGDTWSRHAVLEAVNTRLLRGAPAADDWKALAKGFASPEPAVRAALARLAGVHRADNLVPELVKRLQDPDPHVRRMAIHSLGTLQARIAVKALAKAAVEDAAPRCRAHAALALGSIDDDERTVQEALERTARDKDEIVRTFTAIGLGSWSNRRAEPALERLVQDSSIYVRKAAAEGLLKHNIRGGLPVLIDSLSYHALDTSSDNYGSNLGALLAGYTNVNFGRDQAAWQQWYRESGDKVDLAVNNQARQALNAAETAAQEGDIDTALRSFEECLRVNPDYQQTRAKFAALLNEQAWNLAASAASLADTERAIALAQRAVELDPQPNYRDSLAEALFQAGKVAEAVAQMKWCIEAEPKNEYFRAQMAKFTKSLPTPAPSPAPFEP